MPALNSGPFRQVCTVNESLESHLSAKTTSGPSKPRTSAPAKRGRPVGSRAKAIKNSPIETEDADSATPEPVVAEKKPRGRRPAAQKTETEAVAKTATPSRRRTKAVAISEEESAPETAEVAPVRRGRRPKSETVDTDTVSAPRRKARKPAPETTESVEAVAPEATKTPAPKRRGRKPKVVSDAVVEEVAAPAPKKRGRKPKVVAAEATPEVVEPADTPKPRRGRKPKAAVAAEVSAPEPAEAEARPEVAPLVEAAAAPAKAPARRGRPRKVRPEAEAPVTAPAIPEVVAETKAEPAQTEVVVAVETSEDRPRFADLGLSNAIMRAIQELGYEHPTPIQAQAIPEVLKGHDVLGVAQTGTGKTASFTLPMIEKLSGSRARARMPRSLILEPTRELALQVADNFKLYGKHLRLTHALLIGGESMAEQREVLNRGVDVLIATPGRLLDLFGRGGLLLTQTSTLVIDEADRMLDMGFIPDIEKIVSLLPANRQTLFFSATMAPEIRRLADAFLRNPVQITVSRPSSVATTIEEGLIVVEEDEKRRALRKLLQAQNVQNAIVFCNRKRDVDMLQRYLTKHGFAAGHLHGDLAQSLRFSTLDSFKSGELKILVCSDVAGRGIDIGGLSHVFNFDLPFNAEDYVHRIGRTGRAGKHGHAFSIAGPRDRRLLDAIETLTGKVIPRLEFAGIQSVDWAQEDENGRLIHTPKQALPSQTSEESSIEDESEGQRRNKRRRGGRKRNRTDRDETQVANAPQPVATPVAQPAPHDRQSVELAPAFENDAPKTGFGGDTPAFMLVPRRHRLSVAAETDLTLPVQHDARHYGDE